MGKVKRILKKVVHSDGFKYALLLAGAVILGLISDDNNTGQEDEDTNNTYDSWLDDEGDNENGYGYEEYDTD